MYQEILTISFQPTDSNTVDYLRFDEGSLVSAIEEQLALPKNHLCKRDVHVKDLLKLYRTIM